MIAGADDDVFGHRGGGQARWCSSGVFLGQRFDALVAWAWRVAGFALALAWDCFWCRLLCPACDKTSSPIGNGLPMGSGWLCGWNDVGECGWGLVILVAKYFVVNAFYAS